MCTAPANAKSLALVRPRAKVRTACPSPMPDYGQGTRVRSSPKAKTRRQSEGQQRWRASPSENSPMRCCSRSSLASKARKPTQIGNAISKCGASPFARSNFKKSKRRTYWRSCRRCGWRLIARPARREAASSAYLWRRGPKGCVPVKIPRYGVVI